MAAAGGAARSPTDGLTAAQVSQAIDKFLVENQAALRVNDAARPHGQIIAFNNRTYDVTQAVPTVVMRNEDYGRIARILADGTPVTIEATIVNKTLSRKADRRTTRSRRSPAATRRTRW